MIDTLFIATGNAHKLVEIRAIFSVPNLKLVDMNDYSELPEVVEDQDSFVGNAVKKAVELAKFSGQWTLADDSGLEVDALGGDPGVYSARYAGEDADYLANNSKLLHELKGVTERSARFRCVIALCSPDGEARTVEGCCEGKIALAPSGDSGFGYDPLFIPVGESRTFAEMSDLEKNAVSHRGVALANADVAWKHLLVNN
ncbi:MAG: RdgB/HAM1 family non-canonical purine NTP pyrophosphatase [Kiritimatiellae bacterium]|nr:RdgB/HAM1 family non-canonical purine NTP pyrophosphatase [Kiritimatiellia bacterium]